MYGNAGGALADLGDDLARMLCVSCSTSLRICSVAGVPALEEAIPMPTGQSCGP
jgi:hypothetical protein